MAIGSAGDSRRGRVPGRTPRPARRRMDPHRTRQPSRRARQLGRPPVRRNCERQAVVAAAGARGCPLARAGSRHRRDRAHRLRRGAVLHDGRRAAVAAATPRRRRAVGAARQRTARRLDDHGRLDAVRGNQRQQAASTRPRRRKPRVVRPRPRAARCRPGRRSPAPWSRRRPTGGCIGGARTPATLRGAATAMPSSSSG